MNSFDRRKTKGLTMSSPVGPACRVPKALSARGFTLIELLVVIAIIAVLAALLLPTLQSAKKAGLSASCRSNLRQVAVAGIDYSMDYGETLPYNGNQSDPASFQDDTGNWYTKLAGVYKAGSTGDTAMHCPQAALTVRPRLIFVCRSDFDFSANYRLTMKVHSGRICMGPRVANLTDKLYWFADAEMQLNGTNYYPTPWRSMSPSAGGLPWTMDPNLPFSGKGHPGNSANFIFGDSHVEILGRTSLAERTAGDSNSNPPSAYTDFNGWVR